MKKSFSIGDIGNISKLHKQVAKQQNIQIIGNQVVASTQKQRLNIIKANDILNKNHTSSPVTSSPSTLAAADSFLDTISCTVITTKKRNFSFMDDLMNEEDGEIKNPNIGDRARLRKLRNKQKNADGEFPNVNDPFWELDSEISRKEQLQNKNLNKRKNRKQRITLAADLATMNLSKKGRPLKYFT